MFPFPRIRWRLCAGSRVSIGKQETETILTRTAHWCGHRTGRANSGSVARLFHHHMPRALVLCGIPRGYGAERAWPPVGAGAES